MIRRFCLPGALVRCICAGVLVLLVASCSGLLTTTVIEPAMGNLQQQTDVELVCEGAPAYLLMVDSMVAGSPEDRNLLLTATKAYVAYNAVLGPCGRTARTAQIAAKAKKYGTTLLRMHCPPAALQDLSLLEESLAGFDRGDIEDLFWGASGWLSWIQTEKGSPASLVDLTIVERIMARLLDLDETYQDGMIHLFFALYHSAKPAMFGGRPDLARVHFEKALSLSGGKLLLVQTAYAETLARSSMDQALHDRLLQEVLQFDLTLAPEHGLSNQIAKQKAQQLLADNYFGE